MTASVEVRPNLRDEARMNIHRVLSVTGGGVSSVGNPDGLHYVWKPGGEKRWRDLKELLDQLQKLHKIDDRAGLEDAVDAAALIYHHGPSALPKDDLKYLLKAAPKVTEALRDENDTRITGMLTDRDRCLVDGGVWKPPVNQRRVDRIMKLGTQLLFNPPVLPKPKTAQERRLRRQMNRRLGLFDGWETSYERHMAIHMRLSRIRADLAQLSRALKAAVPKTRTADMKLLGAVAVLNRRWKSLRGKKVSRTNFVESVIAFIDPDAAAKLPSAMRHRLKQVAK